MKADRHARFLATISDEFPDWLATVAFYTAVEWIEMMLAGRGHHSKSHFDRKSALKKHFPNRALNEAYNTLFNASLDARYLSIERCPAVDQIRSELIARRLDHITKYAASYIS